MSDTTKEFQIEDCSSIHKYRTEIPNIILDMGLTATELKAYVYFKRIAGDKGSCFASNKTLSKTIGICEDTLKTVKKSLVEKNLIKITIRQNEDKSYQPSLIQIIDLWPKNFEHFRKKDNKSFAGGGGKNSTGVGGKNLPTWGEKTHPKEEPIKKEPIKKNNKIVSTPPKEVSKPAKEPISFDLEKEKFMGIDDKHLNDWKDLYPKVDIALELKKMVEWLLANRTKAKLKKKWREFIRRWLEKAQKQQERYKDYKSKKIEDQNSDLETTYELHKIYYNWITSNYDPYYANRQQLSVEGGLIKIYGKDVVLARATPITYLKMLKTDSYVPDRIYDIIISKARSLGVEQS